MDAKEKLVARYRLGLTIQKIISNNTSEEEESLVTSLRKLAAASETEYAIIQKISSVKKDPQFSTLAAIVDGFNMTLSEFANVYESISEKEIEEYKISANRTEQTKKQKSNKTPKTNKRK
jgi:hypothetical protein